MRHWRLMRCGTRLVKGYVVHAMLIVGGNNEREETLRMKKINAKMFLPLAAIALAAPFFAFAVFVGLRAVEIATDARQSTLLLALAVVTVTSSALGARGSRKNETTRVWSIATRQQGARGTSVLHPGL